MLVWLKVKKDPKLDDTSDEFQFHAGLIKSELEKLEHYSSTGFQFHAGLIKSGTKLKFLGVWEISFNSMLVWLKVLVYRDADELRKSFNSMLVWLKDQDTGIQTLSIMKFQFHAGLIKSLFFAWQYRLPHPVSIPCWSD